MTESRPWRVAIWCAVSSPDQAAEDKESLGDQEQRGRSLAADIGGHVVAVFRVPGISRQVIFWQDAEAAIPAYRELREACEADSFDILWAYDTDRLGRTSALSSQVLDLVESRQGREVYIATAPHPIGQKTIAHRYAPMFQGVRSDEEQRRRVEKLRVGMKNRVLNLQLPGSRWPAGYTPVRDERGRCVGAEFNDQIGAVQLLTEWFLIGVSYLEMTRRIEESQYPPPGGGAKWSSFEVHSLMNNDLYAGYVFWGPYRSDVVSSKFPALWDEETYNAVIVERKRRQLGPYARRGSGPYTGVAICARCGRHMGRRRQGPHWYLRCTTYVHRYYYGVECHHNHLPMRRVTAALTDFLSMLADEQALDDLLEEHVSSSDVDQLRARLQQERAKVEDIARCRQRLSHALAAGKMHMDMYRTTDDGYLVEAETRQATIADLEQQVQAEPQVDIRRDTLLHLAEHFPSLLDHGEPSEVARLLQLGGLQVLVEEGQVISVVIV